MICDRCGKENHDTSRFCSTCGNRLHNSGGISRDAAEEAGATYCGTCGARHAEADRFCRACGGLLKQSPAYNIGNSVPGAFPGAAPAAVPGPHPEQSSVNRALVWGGSLTGIAGFFLLPYIISPLAIALGMAAVARRNKFGMIAIAIGFCAILTNYAYLNILTWTAS